MGLLGKKTRSVVGLDIEPGFVAAAEFSNGGGRPALRKAATGSLLPGLFNEGEVTDVDGLAEQLRTFFRDNDLPKVVRLGVASQKVVVRVIELPEIEGEAELDAAVRFQAQEELPMPLEQAVLDHRVLRRFSDGENARIRVLMVAARRDTVDHMLTAARKAGLDPQLIDLSAFAIVRALYVPPNGQVDQVATNGTHVASADQPADVAPDASQGSEVEHLEQQSPPISGEPAASPPESSTALEPAGGDVVSGDVTYTPGGAGEQTPASDPGTADPLEHLLPDDQAGASADVAEPVAPAEPASAEEGTPSAEQLETELGSSADTGATLYCHVSGLTNLAIALGPDCVYTRVLQNSVESMAATLAEQKGLTIEHARQWLKHVGLEKDVNAIEGERDIITAAREVLQTGASRLSDEVRLSLEYYQGSVADAEPVERVVLAGQVIAVGGIVPVLEREIGLPVEPRSLGALEVRPGALDGVDGSQLTVAAGLGIDEVGSA